MSSILRQPELVALLKPPGNRDVIDRAINFFDQYRSAANLADMLGVASHPCVAPVLRHRGKNYTHNAFEAISAAVYGASLHDKFHTYDFARRAHKKVKQKQKSLRDKLANKSSLDLPVQDLTRRSLMLEHFRSVVDCCGVTYSIPAAANIDLPSLHESVMQPLALAECIGATETTEMELELDVGYAPPPSTTFCHTWPHSYVSWGPCRQDCSARPLAHPHILLVPRAPRSPTARRVIAIAVAISSKVSLAERFAVFTMLAIRSNVAQQLFFQRCSCLPEPIQWGVSSYSLAAHPDCDVGSDLVSYLQTRQ